VEASRLDMPLRVLTFAMVFLGVLSIVLTGLLPPPEPLIAIAVLLVGFFFWKSRIHTEMSSSGSARRAPRRTVKHRIYLLAWHILTLLFLAWCGYDLFMGPFPAEEFTVRIPIAAMRLSIFLQIFKVYNAKTDRDYVDMFLLSFFQFVSCAGVSVELYLLLLLLLYLVVTMWALTLFHFRRQLSTPEAVVAAGAVVRSGRRGRGRLLTGGFFAGTFLASVLVAVIGAIFFIIFPRLATSDNPLTFQGFFGTLGTRFSSGLSDSVDLDIAGIINRDPRPVMRAAFPTLDSPPHPVLWRRGALHQYDGKRKIWLRPGDRYSSRSTKPPQALETLANIFIRKSPGLFIVASDSDKYSSIEELRNDPELIPQQYTLIRRYSRAPIFSASSAPVAVVADVRTIACNVNDSYYFWYSTRRNFTYTVFSRIPRQPFVQDESESTPSLPGLHEAKRKLYTQLPADLSPRFNELAIEITQHVSTDYEKARAIRNYLNIHCQYSLELTRRPGRKGPLYDFLFGNKPGHCEYFASAMVILARELGMPSRLAYGYSSGRWNSDTNIFEVRELDAHAWGEVFINGKGWVPFDPTPPIPDDDTPQTFLSILLSPFTGSFRFCQEQWADGVIGYSRFKQKSAYSFVAAAAKNILRAVKKIALFVWFVLSQPFKFARKNLLLGLPILLAAASVLLAVGARIIRFKRRQKSRLITGKSRLRLRSRLNVKFYQKMLRLLTDKGLTKTPADTPLEFAERVVSRNQAFSDVKTVTDLYYLVRFGNGKLTAEQYRAIHSILRRLNRPIPR